MYLRLGRLGSSGVCMVDLVVFMKGRDDGNICVVWLGNAGMGGYTYGARYWGFGVLCKQSLYGVEAEVRHIIYRYKSYVYK